MMLFYPGAISQTLATLLFFVVIIGGGYGAIRIWHQNQKIESLEKKVAHYEVVVSTIDRKEALLRKNIELLKRNCNREVKSITSGGKLDVENLFKNEPR